TSMNRRTPMLRKSLLSLALGTCLSALAVSPAYAQSAMGAVAGRATAGDTITLVNTATGASRSITVSDDGSYRISQLPVGDYVMTLTRDGSNVGEPLTVSVPLGGTATIYLGNDGRTTNNLETVEVI